MNGAPPRLEVGRIDRAHGLKGEVLVRLVTPRTERVDPGSRLWAGETVLEVLASRPHQDRWIVAFRGVTGREAADALRGTVLAAPPLDAADGELWVHELVGATVTRPDGRVVGEVVEVQANPAHDLLVLADGSLVPVVFVVDSSGLPASIVIDPPPGLLADDDTDDDTDDDAGAPSSES